VFVQRIELGGNSRQRINQLVNLKKRERKEVEGMIKAATMKARLDISTNHLFTMERDET